MTGITADYSTIANQAPKAVEEYLLSGIQSIDAYLGDGYAKDHPELLAAFIKTASMDLFTAVLSREINEGLRDIANSILQAQNAFRTHDIYDAQMPK